MPTGPLNNRFVFPASISQRSLVRFDYLAYDVLPNDFEGIELSPVAPLGVNSVLADTDQKNVMAAIRNVEVAADPTTLLAIECAKRRQELLNLGLGVETDVKVATSLRTLRTQDFADIPGFKPHFKIFALATGWEDELGPLVEIETIAEHVEFYLELLERLPEYGYWFGDVTVYLSDIRITEALIKQCNLDRKKLGRETQNSGFDPFEEAGVNLPTNVLGLDGITIEQAGSSRISNCLRVLENLGGQVISRLALVHRDTKFLYDLKRLAGIGYYRDFCFKITATNREGQTFPLVDGGTTHWTSLLLHSKKERMVASGIGTEIVCQNF